MVPSPTLRGIVTAAPDPGADAVIRRLRAETIEIKKLKVEHLEVAGREWTIPTDE